MRSSLGQGYTTFLCGVTASNTKQFDHTAGNRCQADSRYIVSLIPYHEVQC